MVLEKQRPMNINRLELPALPDVSKDFIKGYVRLSHLYRGAMMEVSTKLDILDDEFSVTYDHNPIHHMECRLKSAESTVNKLKRKGFEVSTQNIMEHIQDVAGVRVICNYTDDIYRLSHVLEKHKDFTLIRKTDYIENPKPNGYRSYHLITGVPIYYMDGMEYYPVEIQFRTISMDFWAAMEHRICYKSQPFDELEMKSAFRQYSEILEKMEKSFEVYSENSD